MGLRHNATDQPPRVGRGLTVVVNRTDITEDANYERHEGDLRLVPNTNFPFAEADAITTPPPGFTWMNSGALTSADTDTTTSNALNVEHSSTSTDWSKVSQTGPVMYKTVPVSDGMTKEIVARLSTDADASVQNFELIVINDDDNTTFHKLGIRYNATGLWLSSTESQSGIGATTSTAITTTQRDDGIWVRMVIANREVFCYYNLTNQSSPPTSWTQLDRKSTFDIAGGLYAFKIGLVVSNSAGGSLIGDLLYYRDDFWEGSDSDIAAPKSNAGGCNDANPSITLLADWDLGANVVSVNEPRLRTALKSALAHPDNDNVTWTFSVVRSTTTGAAAGTFAVPTSVSVSGSGRYLSIFAKANSNGEYPGRLMLPIVIPIDD